MILQWKLMGSMDESHKFAPYKKQNFCHTPISLFTKPINLLPNMASNGILFILECITLPQTLHKDVREGASSSSSEQERMPTPEPSQVEGYGPMSPLPTEVRFEDILSVIERERTEGWRMGIDVDWSRGDLGLGLKGIYIQKRKMMRMCQRAT